MVLPKGVKGCYNCMKRRIICDRTEPHCKKCAKKNLICPGLGPVRYRFNDGVAARGKLKGKYYHVEPPATECMPAPSMAPATASLTWIHEDFEGATCDKTLDRPALHTGSEPTDLAFPKDDQVLETEAIATQALYGNVDEYIQRAWNDDNPAHFEAVSHTDILELPHLQPCLELVDAKTRHLFSYFADYVAPVMILVDDMSNGYRHIILPLAVENPMVRRAVCVASAFHMSVQRPELKLPAESGRAAIITKLKSMAACGDDLALDHWATIILLLVGELVNGSDDILSLYQLLKSFLRAKGSIDDVSDMSSFLHQQTTLLEFFASPVIDEADGAQALLKAFSPTPMADWPDSISLSQEIYNAAYQQACDIYILRASSQFIDLTDEQSIRLVTRLRDLLAAVDPSTAGAHTLVWPYFVGAAESLLPEHRDFFQERLQHMWTTTRYRNVKVAIDALPRLWAQRGRSRWTKMLREVATVIM